MSIAKRKQPTDYESFNDFFTRELEDGCRPVDKDSSALCSPADSLLSQVGRIDDNFNVQAKGKPYNLERLLGNWDDAQQFQGGNFSLFYLSPKDYHRVHMPYSGKLKASIYVPGMLYSVNQKTVDKTDQLFEINERLVAIFETDKGLMAVILIGAVIVNGIQTPWFSNHKAQRNIMIDTSTTLALEKGQEMGQFMLGGSSAIILTSPDFGHINWTKSTESNVKYGEKIATIQ